LIQQRAFLAAIANWSGRLVELLLGFLITPFILHRLGDTQYGLYMVIGAVFGQGALLDFAITPAVIKYVAEHRAQRDDARLSSLIATAQVLYFAIGFLTLLLTVALAATLPNFFNVPPSEHSRATFVVLLMGLRLAVTMPCKAASAVLWGLHCYGRANAINVFGAVASAAAIVVTLLLRGDIIDMVAATIPVTLAAQVLTFWCVRRVAPELRFSLRGARREFVKTVASFSASLSLAHVAYNVQTKSDEIIIGAFLPVSGVAPYAIAGRLAAVPPLVAEQALGGFLPLSSELHAKGDSDRLRSLYIAGSRITLAICIPLAGILVALAGLLLTAWVGAQYAVYAPILVVLTLAGVLEISHWPGQVILQGIGRHQGLGIAYLCAATAKLGLAVVFVRPYGLMGVALATLVAGAGLSFIYILPYTARTLRSSLLDLFKRAVLPAFIPALPMTGVLYTIVRAVEPTGLITLGCTAFAGLVTYALVYVIFCAGDTERDLLRTVLAKMKGNAEST
jgi:O-antigen/teichoic acid export membrane protein